MNVFEAVKQSVTTRQAAEHYGIHVGRNGMACCPFHNDKTPSMKLDRRYHCFGCGADGDVIDFAAALYGLRKKEAAVQLAQDFGLSYEDWKPPGKEKKPKPRQKSPEEQFQEAKNRCFRILADYLHLLMAWRNRRFIPVMVYPEQAEVHILEDEAASRAYIEQMWAEAMEIYRSGRFKLAFSPAMQRYLKEHQRDFMPEDTKAGMIQAYLDKYTGSMVCSKQLYKEALNHAFDEPKQWEIREINEIMNQCIDRWRYFPNPRMFLEYGRQKGWERENPATDSGNPSEKTMDGFVEVTEQMELPF